MGQIKGQPKKAPARAAAAARAPRVVVFAGPNGAGKSTHADAILDALGIPTFVNADYIARGLSGTQTDAVAIAAGRIMLHRLRDLAAARQDFAFESTLSSRSFAPFLASLKVSGYRVAIYYFTLDSAPLAVRRVKLRVSLGGHDVPPDVVKRRFARSRANFVQLYAPLADEWAVFDNSSGDHAQLIAESADNATNVLQEKPWQKLLSAANSPKS